MEANKDARHALRVALILFVLGVLGLFFTLCRPAMGAGGVSFVHEQSSDR